VFYAVAISALAKDESSLLMSIDESLTSDIAQFSTLQHWSPAWNTQQNNCSVLDEILILYFTASLL